MPKAASDEFTVPSKAPADEHEKSTLQDPLALIANAKLTSQKRDHLALGNISTEQVVRADQAFGVFRLHGLCLRKPVVLREECRFAVQKRHNVSESILTARLARQVLSERGDIAVPRVQVKHWPCSTVTDGAAVFALLSERMDTCRFNCAEVATEQLPELSTGNL